MNVRVEHRQRDHRGCRGHRERAGRPLPEAGAAAALFAATRDLRGTLGALASGRELIADGFAADVDLAAAHDVSDAVPTLRDGFLQDLVMGRTGCAGVRRLR